MGRRTSTIISPGSVVSVGSRSCTAGTHLGSPRKYACNAWCFWRRKYERGRPLGLVGWQACWRPFVADERGQPACRLLSLGPQRRLRRQALRHACCLLAGTRRVEMPYLPGECYASAWTRSLDKCRKSPGAGGRVPSVCGRKKPRVPCRVGFSPACRLEPPARCRSV